MDSDRLKQLRRQKALLEEHLAWIQQEIDRATLEQTPPSSPKASRLKEVFPDTKPIVESLRPLDEPRQINVASDLYSELGPDTRSAAADTKRGCLIISAVAFGLLGLLVAYVVFWYK